MSFVDNVIAFTKVIATSITTPNSEVVYNVSGISGFRTDASGAVLPLAGDDADESGEVADGQVAYQSLGILARPVPPDADDPDLFAEALTLRTADGLLPFAYRDLRFAKQVNPGGTGTTPAEGQIMFAGYGGAFLSHALTADPVGSQKANITTWYCPYDFVDGVPQKAHTISIDPTPGNSSISLVHADGVFFTLTEDADGSGNPGITWAVDDDTFGSMIPGEVTINAAKIMMKGNVYLGAQAETGLPLLAGPASPPCPSLFVSTV